MIQLDELIKPTWSPEKALNQAWAILNEDEKLDIQQRIDNLFYNELPFQLEHDKILYIHLFSLVAQLETMGLRGLIKSLDKLSGKPLYQKMRQQIIDEIFHATLFTKIAFQLSSPHALPLGHNKNISQLISSLEKEDDLGTALTFINLIAEGWIEELFRAMKDNNIAASVFEAVLEDESRHFDEYDLYQQIGFPNGASLKKKMSFYEEELISVLFAQEAYVVTLATLLGRDGLLQLIDSIVNKHNEMLKKIGLTSSENWQFFMKTLPSLVENMIHDTKEDKVLPSTNTRKVFSFLWNDPELPTQSALFSINVTQVGFFEKKFGPETITCLMLQALSKTGFDNPQTRNYMANHKIYHSKECFVGLAVKLPDCGDQIGVIEFKNCHDMSMFELANHIQNDMNIMIYCYKKMQQLKQEHPHLEGLLNTFISPRHEQVYREPLYARPAISLSNIGHWGYEGAISPLFPNETVKCTLAKVDRKQVWNKTSNQFEIQDLLPVGISVDHRVMDANIPIPTYVQEAFDYVFLEMEQSTPKPYSQPFANMETFIEATDKLLQMDLELGFKRLFYLTTIWKNYSSYDLVLGAGEPQSAPQKMSSSKRNLFAEQ